MTPSLNENMVEDAVHRQLEELGWEVLDVYSEQFGENGTLGRELESEVVLKRYLREALVKFNPDVPAKAIDAAILFLSERISTDTIGQANHKKYQLLKGGVPVTFVDDQGEQQQRKLRVFDFKNATQNHFLALRQLWVQGEMYRRRPDVVCFVNGLPLVFMELKAAHRDVQAAYNENLRDYKDTIASIFDHNAFVILSNGLEAKVGTITSLYQFFFDWKRVEEDEEGEVSLETVLKGTCAPHRLMDLFQNFLLFDTSGGRVVKYMAKNHQYIGVNKVMENVERIEDLQGKLGVYWHTQGSGKSLSMVFLGEKIHQVLGGGYTIVVVVDRTELERQIYDTFSGVGVVNDQNLVAGRKDGMTGREHLRELLGENHRYVFTLIHKFSIDKENEDTFPLLTERKNVIVLSDEAHRTQGGIYARNMRYHALPNASFLGYTGTPLISDGEELTKDIFGDYVSIYGFKRAIEDKATLPLRYLNRGEKLEIEQPDLDEKMAEAFDGADLDDDQRRKAAYLFRKSYPVLTATERLRSVARDVVWHFNERGYQGKGMFVAIDKPTAVKMHDFIVEQWPDYLAELKGRIDACQDPEEKRELQAHFDRAEATEVCVVVSSEQNEVDTFRKLQLDIEPHRRKMVERDLEAEFKDADHNFRLVIVCAMWITGFDAQCVSTVYLDKPLKGHTLMQTIARANRVYDDEKESGLIVDYGNVYGALEKAYAVYGDGARRSGSGQVEDRPIEELAAIVEELRTAIGAVREHLASVNFDLSDLTAKMEAMTRLGHLGSAVNAVQVNETVRTTFEVMARNVFRKYKALYPHELARQFNDEFDAIEGIYKVLHRNAVTADITDFLAQLQELVDASISVKPYTAAEDPEEYIAIGDIDIEKLKAAFAKAPHKNSITYNLQEVIDRKLQQMLRQNPLRLEFYDRYKEIIAQYNQGKSFENTERAFQNLTAFLAELNAEEVRVLEESDGDEALLAIFDLLVQGKTLTDAKRKKVKKVAADTLEKLQEKLRIERWRESREITAAVRLLIKDSLYHLPEEDYPDDELETRTIALYQHVHASYYGGGQSVYQQAG